MAENGNDSKRDAADILLNGWMDDGVHVYRLRVYYADTDLSGAVYHARYLEMLERGRSDFLRLSGVLHSALEARDDPQFWVVRRMEIDWLAGARIEDVLEVHTRVASVSGARVTMSQAIMRQGTLIVTAQVLAALINEVGKPQRFPKDWIDVFCGHTK